MPSADLAALRARLSPLGYADLDLDAARRELLAAGGLDDADALLAFLRDAGRIDDVAFACAASYDTVVVAEHAGGSGRQQHDIPTVMMALADEPTLVERPRQTPKVKAPAPPAGGEFRYVVVGTAGKGGMGTVRVARDVALLRKVALKELAVEAAGHETSRARFVREVQVTAQLDHPHIVPVYGLEVAAQGQPAYAMKLVEGRTFGQLLAETRAFHARGAAPDEAHGLAARLEHFLKVCDAIAYAHAKGVIHRDLKPANLMLGAHHEVYVMDWGLCRVLARPDAEAEPSVSVAVSGSGETQQGTIMGTPSYMSPEQALGRQKELGPASDQCALGLILYEMVTLRTPYEGDSLVAILAKASERNLGPMRHAHDAEAVPPELQAVIERATRKEPGRRYPSVEALADDLRRFLRGEAVEARPDTRWQQFARRLSRHRQGVAVALLGLVTLILGSTAFLLWRHERALEERAFREHRLQELVNDVGRQGDVLQRHLIEVEGELEALAAVTAHDLAALPPTPQALEQAIVRGEAARKVLFERARQVLRPASDDAASPIIELRLVLESGREFRHPPRAAAADAGDPRQQAWYRAARERNSHWGEPLSEAGATLLPLSTAVRTLGTRETLGAVSLLLSLDGVLDEVVRLRPAPAAEEVYLLDPTGRVLAARSAAKPLPLSPFPDAALLGAVAADELGHAASTAFGAPAVLVFDRIHPLEWILVAVAPEQRLYARP